MKKLFWVLLTLALMLSPSIGFSAQTAQARFTCLSLRVQRGSAVDFIGIRWTLDMTTLQLGINAELQPGFVTGGYSNGAWVELEEEFGSSASGIMGMNTPAFTDANANGFSDFFEVSQAVPSLTGQGFYNIPGFGNGAITVTWTREAGAAVGSCIYVLPDPFAPGEDLIFYHLFELIEFVGPLSYTPGSNTVPVTLSLTNTNTLVTLEGPAVFLKSPTNRFNQLTITNAFLTNSSMQVLDLYSYTRFLRTPNHRTNYVGIVDFNDGDPNTTDADYYTWLLSFDDLNDSDSDGIPDFSDDPQSVTPPRRPLLSLARGPTNLLLNISGDVGRTHHVLESSSLAAGNWVTNLTLTLTNDPQVISLPLPAGGTRFWRATAQ